MARINLKDLDKYGNSNNNGGSYFSLKKNKEVASVRFLLDDVEDLDNYIYSVHEVKIGDSDKPRYVSCLREYDEPVSACPFCSDGKKIIPKVYVPLYNIDADEVQIWERGKSMITKLVSTFTRYQKKGAIVNNIFEIERNGEPKDKKTTYELYQVDSDDTSIDDLNVEIPKILGRYILDKSADDMNYYLDEGEFPPADDTDEDERPVRRRGNVSDDAEEGEDDIADEKEEKGESRASRRRGEEVTKRRTPNRRREF